ncbi:MAG: hypothetical protein DPW09_10015 [Anaerolineae bacterium]|nr:hypothetical protein [Anaerolineae bacterium]
MTKQVWKFEPTERWVRATHHGETIADSKRVMLMIESMGELDYYFPVADVRLDLLTPSDHTETSGYRGGRKFWHLKLGEQVIENAAWTYEPKDNRPDFSDYLALAWKAMDHWYEEEEEIFYHPRNPYHRVDTLPSSRHVEVLVDGVKVADTVRPYLLFETHLPTRYYIPPEDIETEYLTPTNTQTICPYKGVASYYSVIANGETLTDIVWTYPNPILEAPKIKGLLAFWPEKDKRIQIFVDGELKDPQIR